jgi:hypothetical protein
LPENGKLKTTRLVGLGRGATVGGKPLESNGDAAARRNGGARESYDGGARGGCGGVRLRWSAAAAALGYSGVRLRRRSAVATRGGGDARLEIRRGGG